MVSRENLKSYIDISGLPNILRIFIDTGYTSDRDERSVQLQCNELFPFT
jgi:hypothetical protein